jgi:plasmid stability protein
MAQLLVRRLDEDVKQRLRERAKRHGVSMEQEARAILRAELLRPQKEGEELGLGTRIAALFRDIPDNDEPLPELPDEPIRPAKFDE